MFKTYRTVIDNVGDIKKNYFVLIYDKMGNIFYAKYYNRRLN